MKVPFERWWQVLVERRYPGIDGRFIHPVSDPAVIAGNGTIGLEILEDLPDVATRRSCPTAAAGCRAASPRRCARSAPRAQVFACEVETAAPLAAVARRRRAARDRATRRASSTASAARACSPRCGRSPRRCSPARCVVSLEEIAAAVRLLVERDRVVAEGAGAASLAAALAGRAGHGRGAGGVPRPEGPVVCVVSGGNIDPAKLATILEGRVP